MDWAPYISQIKGGYIRPDNGAACLPVIHHETGEIMGWQVREDGSKPNFGKGILLREAAPLFRPSKTPQSIALILEGPSDFATVSKMDDSGEFLLAATWSATIMPPLAWIDKNIPRTACIVTCGDGDAAGDALPQLFADRAQRCVYPAKIPKTKDARDIITEQGWDRFTAIIARAVFTNAIEPAKPRKPIANRSQANPTSVSIEDLLTAAGARMTSRMTTGQLKYRCPLHDDRKNPSLTADPASGSWKCWSGCGQGGPVQFVMAWRRCSYDSAREYLARIAR